MHKVVTPLLLLEFVMDAENVKPSMFLLVGVRNGI